MWLAGVRIRWRRVAGPAERTFPAADRRPWTDREAAWFAVHEALPAFWRVGPITYDPGVVRPDGLMGAFSVTARGPHLGRGKMPVAVSGTGEDEIRACATSTVGCVACQSRRARAWTSYGGGCVTHDRAARAHFMCCRLRRRLRGRGRPG
jgi:hypothetical protein